MNQSVLGLTDYFKKFFDKVGLLDLRYFFPVEFHSQAPL